MAMDLAIIIVVGLLANAIFTKIKLPGLLGMIIVGIFMGPYSFNLLSEDILKVSADVRKIALIIILLRAGFGINKEDLKKVRSPAIRLSCIPGLFEGFTIAYASISILGFTFVQGGILGFIIAAVSPAVIVPSMLDFMEKGIGEKKGIPTLILAGASIDDVFAITIFSTFLGIYSGSKVNMGIRILSIPISIILGITAGAVIGLILFKLFNKYSIRDTKKVLYIIGAGILLTRFEDLIKAKVEIAGLLGVMTIGFIMLELNPRLGKNMAVKLNKIWVFAEILLFVLVGAEVNFTLALDAGSKGILLILIGLVSRSIGVLLSLLNTKLNIKEKLFCIIAYIPKATVQAAIGAIPLSLGVESGDLILSIAVLSIVLTAPLGAIGISLSGGKLLS